MVHLQSQSYLLWSCVWHVQRRDGQQCQGSWNPAGSSSDLPGTAVGSSSPNRNHACTHTLWHHFTVTYISIQPAHVAQWLKHSAAMCSIAWCAQWPEFVISCVTQFQPVSLHILHCRIITNFLKMKRDSQIFRSPGFSDELAHGSCSPFSSPVVQPEQQTVHKSQ